NFFQLQGILAGFAKTECVNDDCRYTAKSIDLRSGRLVRGFSERGIPLGLVMTPTGSLAVLMLLQNLDNPEIHEYVVWRIDRDGTTTLDRGADIDPHSLAAAGSWVYWTRDG